MARASPIKRPPFVGIAAAHYGLQVMARHVVFFLLTAAGADALGHVLLGLDPLPPHPDLRDLEADVPFALLGLLVGTLTGVAYINVALACAKNQAPAVVDLWPGVHSVLRFARASVSYGFMTLLFAMSVGVALEAALMQYLIIKDRMRDAGALGLEGLAAGVGATALAAAVLVGRWLIDRQFFGHLIIERHLGGGRALRASASLARPVRSSLLVVTSLSIAVAAAFGAVRMMCTDYPDAARPFGIPQIGRDWPAAARSVAGDALTVMQTLAAWLGVLALTFVYHVAERWHATAAAAVPSDSEEARRS